MGLIKFAHVNSKVCCKVQNENHPRKNAPIHDRDFKQLLAKATVLFTDGVAVE